jgi:enterochelin esterase family protein
MPATTIDPLTIVESPRLRRLAADLEVDAAALGAFWAECAAAGTPLFEEIDENRGSAMVTFVWRAVDPLRNVVLLEWITDGDFPDKQMAHLPGTDIWYRTLTVRDDLRTSYQFSPNDSLVRKADETDWPTRQQGWVSDPLNPHRLVEPHFLADPGLVRYDSSILAMPKAAPQPWIVHDPAVRAGAVEHHRFASETLGNERDLWVYTPAGYDECAHRFPVVVLFDGERHDSVMRTPVVLDNLIAAGEIPPVVALMIGNVDRGNELPCSEPFAQALVDEIMPWLAANYRVTDRPSERVVAGQSYGGLAAAFVAIWHPETVGNVLSQSGSFWWKPDPLNDTTEVIPGDAPEYAWLPSQVARRLAPPVRFWMEVGTLEARSSRDGMPSMISTNRHMRDVLIAKGCDVQYREFRGGHDYAWWRHSLAEGLIALLGAGAGSTKLKEQLPA